MTSKTDFKGFKQAQIEFVQHVLSRIDKLEREVKELRRGEQ